MDPLIGHLDERLAIGFQNQCNVNLAVAFFKSEPSAPTGSIVPSVTWTLEFSARYRNNKFAKAIGVSNI